MRRIAVATVGRSDYGIYLPILRLIASDPELELRLLVGSAHLRKEFGETILRIEADGFPIAARVDLLVGSKSPHDTAQSMGLGVSGFANALSQVAPDVLVVLGDRFDMHAAALAALPLSIPVAHIHGGELTQGAIDDSLRHSMTKLSHLHFVATSDAARRVVQLGEEPWRVTVSGAPSLDHLRTLALWDRQAVDDRFGFAPGEAFLLVTQHPVTLEPEATQEHIRELLAALTEIPTRLILTYPNADAGSTVILEQLERFVTHRKGATLVADLGTEAYFSLMKHATAMVGNSSSGILEAASFELPVVNIGSRQEGRLRAQNVLDCGTSRREIGLALGKALAPAFREALRGVTNPYGDGHAAERIVAKLKTAPLGRELLRKRFHDVT
jgi:UDP-hydrolysing UDP-N-acetyl-D-glucosamine 2-epimerase